ncbi:MULTISPECIES: GntR family transcriptional regulator [Rhodovulum]|uniref:GntR family transcriptional regulator n=2 Tax=Rhodovulum TaxID=34008 RepID=A0A8E3ARA6_9RHOB|nr:MULTISPECIES: GntR family transcriptional regulator [Rhodovulum]PTW48365.1 GntR family transcriptional regulator [Rhodovulum kholense]RAP41839.1 GntR family transcriptional regulator [Rhodovulum viride]
MARAEDGGERLGAAELAYRAIRKRIFSGHYAENERVTEAEFAESLAMSRTPVREAVKRLILEGLLTREAGPGLRVVGLGADEIEQIFAMRLLLESYAARRAAGFASAGERAQLADLALQMQAHVPPRNDADYEAITEANRAFHQLILTAARSPRLEAMLSLVVNLGLVSLTFKSYDEAAIRRSAAHHKEIAEAILAGDADWAGAAMQTHLHAATAAARRNFGS